MRQFAPLLLLLLVPACSGSPHETEEVGQTGEALTAVCEANVRGVGTIPVETQYLAHVVHCENGGAPPEALKVQAIAARTYLYYKMETAGSIADGQGDQVYSCGSGPDAEQIKAVQETEGLILQYKGTTLCSFFVAGGAASPPSCHGGAASTEDYVTYNEGLSGANIHQTSLGYESPSNYRNRGCMSQLGSRCLANEGKSYEDILHFYYGSDVAIVRATGPCVTAPAPDAGTDAHAADAKAPKSDGGDPRVDKSEAGAGDAATEPPEEAAPGAQDVPQEQAGCAVGGGTTRGGSTAWWVLALAALGRARRRKLR